MQMHDYTFSPRHCAHCRTLWENLWWHIWVLNNLRNPFWEAEDI